MLRTAETETAGMRTSHRLTLAGLLAALTLLVALAPTAAMAGTSNDGSSGPCTAKLTSTQDRAVASFSVDCGDGNEISNVNLQTNENNEGSVEGDSGTDCTERSSREFDCSPTDPATSIGGRFRSAGEDEVCADPRLQIDFSVNLEDGRIVEINNVDVANCSDTSDTSGGEDNGSTPEGGVDSGAGGTAQASSELGIALPIAGGTLIVLALATFGLLVRRNRAAR